MSRILYFDCFNGASGDMVLGALLDAGLPLEELRRALGSLAIDGASVSASRVLRAGVSATKFNVDAEEANGHTDSHHHDLTIMITAIRYTTITIPRSNTTATVTGAWPKSAA